MKRLLIVLFAPGLAFLLLMWIAAPDSRTSPAIYVVVGLSTLIWILCVGIYSLLSKFISKRSPEKK